MKRIFTLLVSAFFFTMVMGQPTALIKKATTAPVIDGLVDEIWATADKNEINVPFVNATVPETPTVGNSWWKALWNKDGIYLLCFVEDDVFVPAYMGGPTKEDRDASYMFDKLEIYFDCNAEKKDGYGPGSGDVNKLGHYQFAPTPTEALVDGGTATVEDNGFSWAFDATTKPNYYVEYFFPFSVLLDKTTAPVDQMEPIGFDVNIMDNDILTKSRNRMDWANAGDLGESWGNMDDAGLITLDGAVAIIDINTLTITGGTEITTDNGTLQFNAALTPLEATQVYKWVVTNGTGMATVNSTTGLITANRNGTVTVKAVSIDDLVNSNELTISISNQMISEADISIIKNGTFELGADKKENWGGPGVVDGEGFYSVLCTAQADIWNTMFGQKVKVADATTKYFVKFKAKASADMIIPVLFEDRGTGNDNNKVVTTTAKYRDNVYGKWDVPVTALEAWYTFDVTFSSIKDNSDYELNFQIGKADGTFSIDNIMMYTEADLALVSNKTITSNVSRVYPNPVGKANLLSVELKSSNVKVAIYNALGQKMIEKVSTGNVVKFDVNSLTKGLYFVRLADGSTQKFIK